MYARCDSDNRGGDDRHTRLRDGSKKKHWDLNFQKHRDDFFLSPRKRTRESEFSIKYACACERENDRYEEEKKNTKHWNGEQKKV